MTWTIDSGMYSDAARKCQLLAGDICLALGPLNHTLQNECAGMAGDHERSANWTGTYDQFAADIVTLAATLANALQRFGDVLAATGYNWWQANRSTYSGPEPTKPVESEPLYDSGMALPTSAKGDNGFGLDEGTVVGLLEKVGKIPNGDVTKLATARDAWKTFSEHATITGAATRIDGINAKFVGSTDPNIAAIEDKLNTLKQAAQMLADASKAMVAPVTAHHDELNNMRSQIQAAVASAGAEIAAAVGITVAIVAIAAVATAGLGSVAAAAGGAVITVEIVEGAALVIKNTVTISQLLIIFGSVVAVGSATGVFTGIPDLTYNGINAALTSIAAMSIQLFAADAQINATSYRNLPADPSIPLGGLTDASEAYIRGKHVEGGANVTPDKSTFGEDVDLDDLIDGAEDETARGPNKYGNYEREVDAGRKIGNVSPDAGGQPTSRYKVITDAWGTVVNMFPVP
ncbi:hypothetical protein [Nocardia huaxiensis]|uniref:hypothetical protein n=1 Tax=Nocardia huaxiensis TaxID=2755382 RepID=UPI001E472599|nr:hypothetical protein [Nocardia huaxiensis]UFS99124.1 hypothetical protein LPY97_15095 [Nocardia huaxiensis]